MKKIIIMFTVVLLIVMAYCAFTTKVYAEDNNSIISEVTKEQGNLIELKENQAKSLEEYKAKYGSDSYGITAYILHVVQVYSIPFCFLGIIISTIYRIIGARHLENAEKGLGMIVAVVTLTVICQVLPLVFALVVKLGRE